MFANVKRIFTLKELRSKIFFTFLLLVVCRIGTYIPVPGIDSTKVMQIFQSATAGSQNLFQLIDQFTGGAFAKMTIIALGIMPYITASIIMQLMVNVVASLQKEMKENPEAGKRKMGKWTRIATLALAIFQSFLYAKQAVYYNLSSPGVIFSVVYNVKLMGAPILFYILSILSMTTGTLCLMWLGEQITDRGIGNGISLIIVLGILSSLPSVIGNIIGKLQLESQLPGQITLSGVAVLLCLYVCVIIGTILVIQGVRKIPIQYARRTIDTQGQTESQSHIPLKINFAGIIPVIFASAFLMFPATIAQFVSRDSSVGKFASYLMPGSTLYMLLFVTLIIVFTYVWTSMMFNPDQIASDLKKSSAFIPGVRQGSATKIYIEKIMNRITFSGASFLAFLAILPSIVVKILHVDQSIAYFFGGTSLLILVGVILDTTKQIQSHMIMKRYDGFMRRKPRLMTKQ